MDNGNEKVISLFNLFFFFIKFNPFSVGECDYKTCENFTAQVKVKNAL